MKVLLFFPPPSPSGVCTYAELRCTKEVVLGQFVFPGDSVALAVEG